jgi:FKBP-type peptidyl-prolyl cis-trans isomerase
MNLKLTHIWIGVLAIGLMGAQAGAEQPLVLNTQKEKLSYSMGVEVERNYKRQGIDFDLELFIRGMRDVLAGEKLQLKDEEILNTLNVFSTELRQKKAGDRVMAGLENKKKGEAFLAENKAKPDMVTLPSSLQYQILRAGNGKKPIEADTVECRYRGTLLDGTEFDNSEKGPRQRTFTVSGAIPGMKEALKLMSVGSKWQLFIPSQLAYGQRGSGRIGPYEMIIYEIELIDIK